MKAIFLHPHNDESKAELFSDLVALSTQKLQVRPLAWKKTLDPPSHCGHVVDLGDLQFEQSAAVVGACGCSLLKLEDDDVDATLAQVGLVVLSAESTPPRPQTPKPKQPPTEDKATE